MKKTILSTAALCLFFTTAALAQTMQDGDKAKQTVDGMSVKTKVADDGKMKIKGKDDAGNSMKATTKPRKGDMSGDMKMHHGGMHHKGMRRDSAKMKMKSSM